MQFALFNLTLIIILASIFASASMYAVHLVSHQRTAIYACAGFLFYFFDVAWVLQDAYIATSMTAAQMEFYVSARTVISLFVGCGFLTSFWLMACEYIDQKSPALRYGPGIAFLLSGCILLYAVPESAVQRFTFYTLRALYLAWALIYIQVKYVTDSGILHVRLKRFQPLGLMLWIMGALVVAVDAYNFFGNHNLVLELLGITNANETADRSYVENILMLACCIPACKAAKNLLSLRYSKPPMDETSEREAVLESNILYYVRQHNLSAREEEVLRMILQGKDNQNIASELQLALSTVKVHVHNILKKTGQSSRQNLVQDFWKLS